MCCDAASALCPLPCYDFSVHFLVASQASMSTLSAWLLTFVHQLPRQVALSPFPYLTAIVPLGRRTQRFPFATPLA